MAKIQRTKVQTTIYKTLHRKLTIEQHEMEISQLENWNSLFCPYVSFLTNPHCQFWSICQGICGILYFKLNGIYAIYKITKQLFSDRTSPIQWNVNLKDRDSFYWFFCRRPCMKSLKIPREVIRSHKSKIDKQHNGEKKKDKQQPTKHYTEN